METARHKVRHARRRRWRHHSRAMIFIGWLAFLAVVLTFIGCSSQRRYEVLSFFFDGVPDPNAPVPGPRTIAHGIGGRISYIHKPYLENDCQSCHQRAGADVFSTPAAVSPDVCITCHAEVQTSYPVMHGPVSANMCLMCHAPHIAPNQHLLRFSSPRLCFECHEPAHLTPRVVEHQMPESNCLSCHSGHGGTTHALLKPLSDIDTTPQPPAPPAIETDAATSGGET